VRFVGKMQFILITWIYNPQVFEPRIFMVTIEAFHRDDACIINRNYIFSPIDDVIKFLVFITLCTAGTYLLIRIFKPRNLLLLLLSFSLDAAHKIYRCRLSRNVIGNVRPGKEMIRAHDFSLCI